MEKVCRLADLLFFVPVNSKPSDIKKSETLTCGVSLCIISFG